PFIKRYGEARALAAGLVFGVVSFLVYGLAPTGTIFLVGVGIYSLIGLVNPALQGLMTRMVGPSEQGQLQGANSSIIGFTGIIGPLIFTAIYSIFITPQAPVQLPGAPFLLSALFIAGALVVAIRVASREHLGEQLRVEHDVVSSRDE
ncbi:MAG TPA: MFS transporter, partial [Candidatus Binatus sp.]|nr:MFS transporter [Candidatus Binatus sp.]